MSKSMKIGHWPGFLIGVLLIILLAYLAGLGCESIYPRDKGASIERIDSRERPGTLELLVRIPANQRANEYKAHYYVVHVEKGWDEDEEKVRVKKLYEPTQ